MRKFIVVLIVSIIGFAMANGQAPIQSTSLIENQTGQNGSLLTSVIDRTITYQGILKDNSGNPVGDANYNLTFRVYNAAGGGSLLWTSAPLTVTTKSGLFATNVGPISLPFDTTYYISVQVQGDAEMSRQMMTMSPYSASADTANYADNADLLDGQHASAFSVTGHTHVITSAEIQDGTIQFTDIGQNGAAGGQVMKWNGSSWEASNDSSGFDEKWSFRITDTADTTLISGGRWGLARNGNVLWGNADSTHINLGIQCTTGTSGHNYRYCTVGGGKENTSSNYGATVGGGYNNVASGEYATIGGGINNATASGSYYATVGGGYGNTASGYHATVGGGISNLSSGGEATVSGGAINTASGFISTVSGGYNNTASGNYATVGSGQFDTAKAVYGGVASGYSNLAGDASTDTGAFIGGGYDNAATGRYSAVGGGYNNTASGSNATISGGWGNIATGGSAAIGGGYSNTAGYTATVGGGGGNTADGSYATVGGGLENMAAGDYSAIVGGLDDTLTTGGDYSMIFGRNVYINNTYRVAFFDTVYNGRLGINRDDRSGGINYPIHVGGNTADGNGAYLTNAGVWTNGSSRTFKENFTSFNGPELLRKISSLSVTTYNYKGTTEKHIGPVAEEFSEAFDTGVIREDNGKRENQYLAAGDVAGVALAGVQELIKQINDLKIKNEQLERRLKELESR